MSNDFNLYNAHTYTTLDVTKGTVRSRNGVDGYPREHYLHVSDISKVVSALLDIPIIKPMDKVLRSKEHIPVKNVGGVDVSENTDPTRMRRMALNYLVAAETAEKMIRSAEHHKAEELNKAAEAFKKQKAVRERQNSISMELYGCSYPFLVLKDKETVNKYLLLEDELEELKVATRK